MRAGRRLGPVVIVLAVLLGLSTVPATAAESAAPATSAEAVPAASGAPRGNVGAGLLSASGPVTAFVELNHPAAVDAYAAARSQGPAAARGAATRARGVIGAALDTVLGVLLGRSPASRELYRTGNAVAGLAVRADAATLRQLASRSDVRSIRTLVPKTVANADAAQLAGVLSSWQQTGRLGDGVKIGIVDTGIDYTHADFAGAGTVAAYRATDHTHGGPSVFPTAKVVGGTDFVGDDYDAHSSDPAKATPRPDPNPLDCQGHGTHVAGTAAGVGVTADGKPFGGDYRALTPDALAGMRIGPGMAPKASLYALRVFGCSGSTAVIPEALDWALDPNGDGDFSDHLDIVNLSLGSDYGAPDDPDNDFIAKLAENGVLPVVAAGNGGDAYDVGGSPGNAPRALSVASTRDAGVRYDGIAVAAPPSVLGTRPGQYSLEFPGYDALDLTKPVVPLAAPDADGCTPFPARDAARVAGRFVWLEWDTDPTSRRCGSAPRAAAAHAAGAAGVVLSSTVENFEANIAGDASIPMVQLVRSATDALRPALQAGTLQLRIAGSLRTAVRTAQPDIVDQLSPFSSRGVRGPAAKPDLAAPGDTITSAAFGTGADRLVLSGTSMSAPFATGVAALVKQAHPDWTPEQLKAATMNTANHDVFAGPGRTGPVESPQRVGTGRIDARAALDTSVVAMASDQPGAAGAVSVGFGSVEVPAGAALSRTRNVTVQNTSDAPVSLDVGYRSITDVPGVSFRVTPSRVSVPARSSATVTVDLRVADPTALRKAADPTVQKIQGGKPRQFVADASGLLVLTPSGAGPARGVTALRVPVSAAPKPVSAVTVAPRLDFDGRDSAALALTGSGLDQGSGDGAYRALVGVFELAATSPELPTCARARPTERCVVNDTGRGGDLRYVGVGSAGGLLAFAVGTWGDLYDIGGNTQPLVDIDTTGDGEPDFRTVLSRVDGTDVLVATTVDLRRPLDAGGFAEVDRQPVNGQYGDVDTNVFDTDVWVLPVSLKALGIDPAGTSARLGYEVGVAGFYGSPSLEGMVDVIDTPLSFDPLAPGVAVHGDGPAALSYLGRPGSALTVTRNKAALSADHAQGLLTVFWHNAAGSRAEVVGLDGPAAEGRPDPAAGGLESQLQGGLFGHREAVRPASGGQSR